MAERKLEDFGRPIKGAKKELAQLRKNGGLTVDDIKEWNDDERMRFVNKSKIFPTPPFEEMYREKGYSKEACYYIKLVKDSLQTQPDYSACSRIKRDADRAMKNASTPEEKDAAQSLYEKYKEAVRNAQDKYTDSINYIKELLLSVKDEKDIKDVKSKLYYYCKGQAENGNYFCKSSTGNAIYSFDGYRASRTIRKMTESGFLMTEEEKALKSHSIIKNTAGTVERIEGRYETYLAIKRDLSTSYYYSHGGDSELFEKDYWKTDTYFVINNNTRKIIAANLESEEEARDLVIAQGIGKSSTKTSKIDFIPPQLSHIERIGENYRHGKNIVEQDMLDVFDLSGGQFGNWENPADRQASVNMCYDAFIDMAKILGIENTDISLGNRLAVAYGARGSGRAVAHYEPLEKVINITKMSGAGSLGHEWAHALDHYIAARLHLGRLFATNSMSDKSNPTYDVMQAIKYNNGTYSEYYSNALQMDGILTKAGNQRTEQGQPHYWASNVELFARAFACYLKDKLEEENERSDYLCGHAECGIFKASTGNVYAYPRGEERKRINAEFDKLFEVLKEKEILYQRREPEPVKEIDTQVKENENFSEGYQDEIYEVSTLIYEQIADTLYSRIDDLFCDILEAAAKYAPDGEVSTNKIENGIIYAESHLKETVDPMMGQVVLSAVKEVCENFAIAEIPNDNKAAFFNEIKQIVSADKLYDDNMKKTKGGRDGKCNKEF